MTRGKYAVRAANRLAEIDAGLVADLREKLDKATRERDEALRSIEQMKRDRDAEVRKWAVELADSMVRDGEDKLAREQVARQGDRIDHCEQVFAVLAVERVKMRLPAYIDIAAIFGQTHRVGDLVNKHRWDGRTGNRSSRRANATVTRLTSELINQGKI